MENDKLSKNSFEAERKHIEERLRRGEDKFGKLDDKIDGMNDVLIRVDERVEALVRKNGLPVK